MPNSTMTNATVAQMVKSVQGDEITLKYKDGEKKIHVAPDTVVVTYVPGDKSELKPGAKNFYRCRNPERRRHARSSRRVRRPRWHHSADVKGFGARWRVGAAPLEMQRPGWDTRGARPNGLVVHPVLV